MDLVVAIWMDDLDSDRLSENEHLYGDLSFVLDCLNPELSALYYLELDSYYTTEVESLVSSLSFTNLKMHLLWLAITIDSTQSAMLLAYSVSTESIFYHPFGIVILETIQRDQPDILRLLLDAGIDANRKDFYWILLAFVVYCNNS